MREMDLWSKTLVVSELTGPTWLSIDCNARSGNGFSCFISVLYMCESCRIGAVVQSVGYGLSVCLSIGPPAWKGWETLLYGFNKSSNLDLKKNVFDSGLEVSMGGVMMEAYFCFCPSLLGFGCYPNKTVFGSIFLETKLQSESLKHLLVFLAYLEPKFMAQNPIF